MLAMFNNVCFENFRVETFKDSPFVGWKSKCTIKKLAEAGFYFSPGKDEPDRVICYVCNVKLLGWKKTDEPWVEHAKQSPSCSFLKTKGSSKNELSIFDFLNIEKNRFHRLNKEEFEKSKKNMNSQIEQLTEENKENE